MNTCFSSVKDFSAQVLISYLLISDVEHNLL